MNERIKELAEQASNKSNYGLECVTDMFLEQFAELIVRETLAVMDATADRARREFTFMGDDVPTFKHQIEIENHFGIE